ncbi:MAG TPA: PadR family transcriptional regulator [Longilinea sp.]|nr:PadR family transcriptional regulator [Longilinea sp.]
MNKPHSGHFGNLSPEMALLGQLYAGPGHGYDLHRKVVRTLGEIWHLSQSQTYTIIKRLERQGDISIQELPQEKLPPRQLLTLTPVGQERFLRWLVTPNRGSIRSIRMEFITRVFFLGQYFPEQLPSAFAMQRTETKRNISRLETLHDELPEDQIYNRMSLDLRLRQLKTAFEWLDFYQVIVLNKFTKEEN